MRLFVVRNGAGNWSQMSASDKVTGDGDTGRWDHNVDRECEPNGAWSVRWYWCWAMGRGCDRDRCRVRWGGYLGRFSVWGEGELRPAPANYSYIRLEARVR
jgi:hypothetical protein